MKFDDRIHQVMWTSAVPQFRIEILWSTSTNRGYHETLIEMISKFELDKEDFENLDKARLLGMGQAYYVKKHEEISEELVPMTHCRKTGKQLPEIQPFNTYAGTPVHHTSRNSYHRYEVLRICDSGD